MNPTIQKLAAVSAFMAVGEAIRELKQVPEGKLYAILMPVMDLPDFDGLIRVLANNGLIRRENDLLIWIEPVEKAGDK